MLVTAEERFRRLEERLRAAQRDAESAMGYAESSARLHHEAICRLYELISGTYAWPPNPR